MMHVNAMPIANRKSPIANRRRAKRGGFTLIEILVATAVLAILGTALIGLMSAAVDAWRRGEASRQVNEKLQAIRRQIADDLTAAVLDAAPVPDFHYTLDTLWSLPSDSNDPYHIVYSADPGTLKTDTADGYALSYFAPTGGSATVTLRIRVPFIVQAALLKARLDVFDRNASVRLAVARNNPNAEDPNVPASTWTEVATLNTDHSRDGAIGGAERDISAAVQGGDIVFVRATLQNSVDDTAQFLRGDQLRAEGRPVLILDCYKDAEALPQRPRPTFAAYYESGAQVVTLARTIPGETEKAALREAGSDTGTEFLNYFDDDGDGEVDEPDDLRALGGRAQVVYRLHPDPRRPGTSILRRAFEAPIGRAIDAVPAHDFISNVLYFGMTFWGGETNTWEMRPELDPDYASLDPVPRPPSRRWLSSRYLPEQVQVTLVLESDRGKRTTTTLTNAIAADFPTTETGHLRVHNTRGFYNVDRTADSTQMFLRDPRHYIKIGNEWIFYHRIASPTAIVVPQTGRGARGTTATAFPQGAEVLRGNTYVFTVGIPAFRHWER